MDNLMAALMTVLVAAGAIGYLLLLPPALQIRRALGHRTRGLAAIIIDGWIIATALFLALYAFVLVRTLGWRPEDLVLDGIRLALAVGTATAPWVSIWALWRWHGRQGSDNETIAQTAAKIVATPPEVEADGGPNA